MNLQISILCGRGQNKNEKNQQKEYILFDFIHIKL